MARHIVIRMLRYPAYYLSNATGVRPKHITCSSDNVYCVGNTVDEPFNLVGRRRGIEK